MLYYPSLLIGLAVGPLVDVVFYLSVVWGKFVGAHLLPLDPQAQLFRTL